VIQFLGYKKDGGHEPAIRGEFIVQSEYLELGRQCGKRPAVFCLEAVFASAMGAVIATKFCAEQHKAIHPWRTVLYWSYGKFEEEGGERRARVLKKTIT